MPVVESRQMSRLLVTPAFCVYEATTLTPHFLHFYSLVLASATGQAQIYYEPPAIQSDGHRHHSGRVRAR